MIVQGVDHNPASQCINPCAQVKRFAQYQPDLIAMVYEDQEFTYKEFTEQVQQWAAHLDESGVRQATEWPISV
ncbi:AMP-binding protein [Corynebacterium diphtheriae]|uniref:AMP-binding protein n=1 Tax=Corynebacterium diphtheriae TaxID=1717 RepID=UPI002108DD4E|nr:AMP-binding protein [Corynebacterium diphtheriae]